MVNPEYKRLDENGLIKGKSGEQILPIYPSTASLRQESIRKIINDALLDYGYLLEENIPEELLKRGNLLPRKEAILNVHFPESFEKKEEAKRRFMLEEILLLEMGILQNRFSVDKANKNIYKLEDNKSLVSKFIKSLDYKLTRAQKRVIKEIYSELKAGKIVNRLIQGDVGSGKTIVSFIMLLYMVENNYQGVIMAPTEILATQHYLGIVDEFMNLDIRVELLTGSVKGKKKEKLAKLRELKNELASKDQCSLESISDMTVRMKDKKKLKKLRQMVFLTALPMGITQWTCIIFWVVKGVWWPFVLCLLIAIVWGSIMIIHYFSNVQYICPECHQTFRPSVKELILARHTPTTRKLTCTKCGHKGFCVEIWGGEEKTVKK